MEKNGFAVEVSNLVIKFGDFAAVDDISFSVKRGEIFGFLGANGAGKTTTIRMLCGLLIPTSGEARISNLSFKDGAENIKKKVGYMSQKFTLYTDLTVEENLNFAAALRKLSDKTRQARTKELFDFIGFNQPTTTLVKNLPGGLKQELSLVAAMLHDPEIVFLDEPTAGVSPAARVRFWSLIRLLAKSGKTVFVTTHYMDEAEQCDRIALMRSGKIIALDSPNELKHQTFPETLIEVEPPHEASTAWIDELKKNLGISEVQPYGLRYHLAVPKNSTFEKVAAALPSNFKSKRITPSLEDVFIRLVEGKDR